LHQVGDLFELNVKLWCQQVKKKVHVCTYVYTDLKHKSVCAAIQHSDIEGSTEQNRCICGQLRNGFLPRSVHKTNMIHFHTTPNVTGLQN